jgi:hypothetical protein
MLIASGDQSDPPGECREPEEKEIIINPAPKGSNKGGHRKQDAKSLISVAHAASALSDKTSNDPTR